MPTEARPVCVFFFPHQDDEFAVFGLIEDCVSRRERPVCFFLTDGQGYAAIASSRNAESRRVLLKLGVTPEDIHFIGSDMEIPDGKLFQSLDRLHLALLEELRGLHPKAVFIPAWEGGHHDHDAAHALGVHLCEQAGCQTPMQFPLYNGIGLPGSLFRVLHPLSGNGPLLRFPFGMRRGCRYVGLCLHYRSQWRTWIGLLPFVILWTFVRRAHVLQLAAKFLADKRPHPGPLLYERRYGIPFSVVSDAISKYVRSINIGMDHR